MVALSASMNVGKRSVPILIRVVSGSMGIMFAAPNYCATTTKEACCEHVLLRDRGSMIRCGEVRGNAYITQKPRVSLGERYDKHNTWTTAVLRQIRWVRRESTLRNTTRFAYATLLIGGCAYAISVDPGRIGITHI